MHRYKIYRHPKIIKHVRKKILDRYYSTADGIGLRFRGFVRLHLNSVFPVCTGMFYDYLYGMRGYGIGKLLTHGTYCACAKTADSRLLLKKGAPASQAIQYRLWRHGSHP